MPQEGVREAAEQGLTLAQLVALVGSPPGATAASLATVLRQEVAAGRVEYSPTSRRYSLAGGLDLETRQALLLLDLGLGQVRLFAGVDQGEGMSASQRLVVFIEVERDRLETRDGDILGAYANQLRELVGFLEVTTNESADATRAWWQSFQEWQAKGGREAEETAEMARLLEEVERTGLIFFLRVETFYLFAKILLDKLARLIPLYFRPGRGVGGLTAHSSLVKGALPRFAKQQGLTPVPPSLADLIQELGRRVSDYRDDWIAHDQALSPRNVRGIAVLLDIGDAAILTERLYPRAGESRAQSEPLRTLLPLIERYVIELLDYLERNHEKVTGRATA